MQRTHAVLPDVGKEALTENGEEALNGKRGDRDQISQGEPNEPLTFYIRQERNITHPLAPQGEVNKVSLVDQ